MCVVDFYFPSDLHSLKTLQDLRTSQLIHKRRDAQFFGGVVLVGMESDVQITLKAWRMGTSPTFFKLSTPSSLTAELALLVAKVLR